MKANEGIHMFFQPTFGNRPEQYIGRDGVIEQFMQGLSEPVGSRNRCALFLGQRGMGKTALLLELSDRASKADYIVARVTAHEGMAGAIIEQFQLNGSPYVFTFKSDNVHYNDYIVIAEDVLINKTDANRQRKIQAYWGNSVLVTAYKGIGYQQIRTDGSLGEVFTQLPRDARSVPDWKRLGLHTLSAVSGEVKEEQRRENLKCYYDQFVEYMLKKDNSALDELLGYGFQVVHEKHVAGKFEFISRRDVRFIDIQTLSYETEDKGNTATITGLQNITYFRQRQQKTEPYNFRMTLKSMNGSWKISGIRYWREKRKT